MFAFFRRYFRFRRAAATARLPAAAPTPAVYTVVPPVWCTDARRRVYRGLSGDAIATVENPDQAITLQDTLNLANGDRPSRRLLDAVYRDTSVTVESAPYPRA